MSQVVVISGASSGIGRATALEFARRGARLVLGSRHEETAASLTRELGDERAVFKQSDVPSKRDMQALVDLAVERFGRLDVAVNSAALEAKASFADFDEETYERVFDTNVKGVCLAMWFEIAAMRHTGGGSIVNVGATSGSRGAPNMSLYAASKHAVEGLTRSVALELAKDGIRVKVVAPGPTLTPDARPRNGRKRRPPRESGADGTRGVGGRSGARHRVGRLARSILRDRRRSSRQRRNVRRLMLSSELCGLSGRCRSARRWSRAAEAPSQPLPLRPSEASCAARPFSHARSNRG